MYQKKHKKITGKKILLQTYFLFYSMNLFSQPLLINNIHGRETTSLNGIWQYIIDPYENGFYNYRLQPFDEQVPPGRDGYFMDAKATGKSDKLEYDWDESSTLTVPGDWNHQNPKFEYYEGSVWYRKSFSYSKKSADDRVFLHFGAVNYMAHVYLNGKKLGVHEGGFTPFQFEITNLLKNENSLVLMVNNTRKAEGVPTLNTDWWNYGGITRDVFIAETPPTFISDYYFHLDKTDSTKISGYVQLFGNNMEDKIGINIPELNIHTTLKADKSGKALFTIQVEHNISYWSPEIPKRYEIEISYQKHRIFEKIGFRTITTKNGYILLNGKPVFLKGISIHEENPLQQRRANSREDAELLLGWAKELGCNYVRLAHYPHNEYMIDVANEKGLLLWEEIPVYWTIHWDNPDTYTNAENQLSAMIQRDKNSAATIIWSLANETPVSDNRNKFLKKLSDKAHELDPYRLVSAAMEIHTEPDAPDVLIVEDKLADYVDVVSFNQYIGWYNGLPGKAKRASWKIPYNKPVIISEFGAGALAGFHADSLTRWSEEFQADTYVQNLRMIDRITNLAGMSPWILADFKSPRRPLPNIQDGWNRKGVISDKGEKKKAFSILKNYYENKSLSVK